MCGRFTLRSKLNRILAEFSVEAQEGLLGEPRFNIAPTQNAATIRQSDGVRRLELRRWGLIPSWAG